MEGIDGGNYGSLADDFRLTQLFLHPSKSIYGTFCLMLVKRKSNQHMRLVWLTWFLHLAAVINLRLDASEYIYNVRGVPLLIYYSSYI